MTKMKFRNLIVSVVCVASLLSGPAYAQMAVIDASAAANTLATVNQLKDQALQLKAQYDTIKDNLKVATDTYDALRHLPDTALQELGAALGVDEFRDVYKDVQDLQAVLNGKDFGALEGLANDFVERNSVYKPTGTDQAAKDLLAGAKAIAGTQATATKLYDSATNRIEALKQLEDQLGQAKDTKAVADIQARLQAESVYVQAQQVQAMALSMQQQAQIRVEEQQFKELRRQQIDAAIDAVRAQSN